MRTIQRELRRKKQSKKTARGGGGGGGEEGVIVLGRSIVSDFKQVAGPEQSFPRRHALTTTQVAEWLFDCFLPLALLYN